jgi:hypothetical protein
MTGRLDRDQAGTLGRLRENHRIPGDPTSHPPFSLRSAIPQAE